MSLGHNSGNGPQKTAYDFRHLKAPDHYRNINDFDNLGSLADYGCLHPTESLMGDYSGTLLILGQDFTDEENLEGRSIAELRHTPNLPTNKNLKRVLEGIVDVNLAGTNNRTCGAVYANYFWFIKRGGNISGGLENFSRAVQANREIYDATIKSMPNLKYVICMGKESFKAISNSRWTPYPTKIPAGAYSLITSPHFGCRGLSNFRGRIRNDRKHHPSLEGDAQLKNDTLLNYLNVRLKEILAAG